MNIFEAIEKATGIQRMEYTNKGRKIANLYPRMILAKHLSREGIHPSDIALMLFRSRSTVIHYLKIYDDEIKYNPDFRKLAKEIEELITEKR